MKSGWRGARAKERLTARFTHPSLSSALIYSPGGSTYSLILPLSHCDSVVECYPGCVNECPMRGDVASDLTSTARNQALLASIARRSHPPTPAYL